MRAGAQVGGGYAQPERIHGLWSLRWFEWRLVERHSTLCKRALLAAIAEQAVMTDPHEVARQHMHKEATDELLRLQTHDADATGTRVVLVAKAHAVFIHGQEPLIGEGDAMRVAAQILQHLCRTCHGALGVDDPGLRAQFTEQRLTLLWIAQDLGAAGEVELAVLKSVAEGCEVFGAKHRRECLDRKEKAALGRAPLAGGGKGAAGDQGVHVNMLRECLAPGVEDERGTKLTAEPARVSAELKQCLRGGVKQGAIDQTRVALREDIELMWEGEHDMKIRRREQLALARFKPAFFGSRLALRAMAVTTGMIGIARFPAGVTGLQMPTQCRRAARHDRAHGAALNRTQAMVGAVGRAMRTKDIGELHLEPEVPHGAGALVRRRGGSYEQIQW